MNAGKYYHNNPPLERVQIERENDARGVEAALLLAIGCAQRANLRELVTDLMMLRAIAGRCRREIEAGARV